MLPPEITIPETVELSEVSSALVARCETTTAIVTDAEYEQAAKELIRISILRKDVERVFSDPKKKAYETHKAITRAETELLAGPRRVEATLRNLMSTYLVEQDRQRRIEAARLQVEEQRKAEAARDQEAEALADAGETEAAVALLSQVVVAPVIEIAAPKAAGISSRKKFRFDIYDAAAVKHPTFTVPDQSKIQKQVDAMGLDAASIVGGIRVWEDRVITQRSGS